MDKARRHELKILKFKKRLRNYGITVNGDKFHVFRTTGKPCSCHLCSPRRFEKGMNKKAHKSVVFEVEQSLGS